MAEFTIGVILAETQLITKGHALLSRGVWRGDLCRAEIGGLELSEPTVGVIGYGHIGTRVVRLLKPFGCRILWTTLTRGCRRRTATTGWSRSASTSCWSARTW